MALNIALITNIVLMGTFLISFIVIIYIVSESSLLQPFFQNIRRNKLKNKCNKLGYYFSLDVDNAYLNFLSKSFLFEEGNINDSNKVLEIVKGNKKGNEFTLFDHVHMTLRKHREPVPYPIYKTVIHLKLEREEGSLDFVLKKKQFMDNLFYLCLFGREKSSNELNSKFSKKYALLIDYRTEGNKEKLKKIFNSKIQEYFANNKTNYVIEYYGSDLLVYQSKNCLKIKDIEKFIDEAIEIKNLFKNNR